LGAPEDSPAIAAAAARPYTVAVRALCEFAAKAGDLDLRFTPAPSSQEGVQGHRLVASRRGPGHRAEVAVDTLWRGRLQVRGRADGFDLGLSRVEEVKTFKGELARMPANHRALHWAQAKVYGWLLCQAHALPAVTVALVYFDVASQQETVLEERCSAGELEAVFDALCGRFLAWAEAELAHRAARDLALQSLGFPHAAFRPGQRELAEAVYKAGRHGRTLMAQAPTGIGKTVGTIFPTLKAMPAAGLDKLHFLTAKGSGRQLALDALGQLRRAAPALPLRVIELIARDKACVHPDNACHGESCPLARGFYDRLAQARAAAVGSPQQGRALDAAALREIGEAHGVCPYYLGQELVRWCDVVVGDYNHFFDITAFLHTLGLLQGWRVALLVDEAHNLVERARSMYSATLSPALLASVRRAPPAALKRPLDRLNRAWRALAKSQTSTQETGAGPYQVLAEVPAAFAAALQEATNAIGDHLADPQADAATVAGGPLLDFYFEAMLFGRLLESFGEHSLFDLTRVAPARGRQVASVSLCVRNLLPAPFLKPRFAAAHGSVLFSATMAPQAFYADTLGLPEGTAWAEVAAPFRPEQLEVRVVRSVSTRWRDRAASLGPIARLIARQYRERPGNYLAFFSSFDYLQQVADELAQHDAGLPVWRQGRQMGEAERSAFLGRFVPEGAGVGFAVLGGVFAEGIDLPGSRLIGAFIATLGLPQVNPVNEEMRRRLDASFDGAGYDYTYLYPGLRKVVQAAGRVIRTLDDEGCVHLIDDRFTRPEVRRLLPAWWRLQAGSGG
jgi:DNA excision repair protein ERCC-2